MKKEIKLLAIMAVMFGLIVTTTNTSFAQNEQPKVAIVNVAEVVAESAEVKALKQEQIQKSKELVKWLETVTEDVKKQQNKEDKEKLMKKYQAQFEKKRDLNQKNYAKKLETIDKNITSAIANQAKLKGYDLVLSKSMVLVGGDDITAEIEKAVK